MSSRGILMPVRLTDLVAAPPSRATNFKVALAALVLVVTAFSSVAMVHFAAPGSGGAVLWREISWPFPRDGWPAGRAFRCDACGGGLGAVELYVRPKIGFCNCTTGVADDDEVDRVADLDLISAQFEPREPGSAVRVARSCRAARAPMIWRWPTARAMPRSASRCRSAAICWWRWRRAGRRRRCCSAWRSTISPRADCIAG